MLECYGTLQQAHILTSVRKTVDELGSVGNKNSTRKHYNTTVVSLVFSTIPEHTDQCAALVLLLNYLLYIVTCARHFAGWVTVNSTGGPAQSPYSTHTENQFSTATIFHVTHGTDGQM